jgi:GNAT superfamily N-acetyltransferase
MNYYVLSIPTVVDEKQRGKGFGTMLINKSIKDSKAKGLKRLELDSAFHREKAHEFYLKLGFEKRAFLFSHSL